MFEPAERESFARDGFVRVKGAFDPEEALRMQDELWRELRVDHGIERGDPATWKTPTHAPRRCKVHPRNAVLAGERFQGAISALVGQTDWERPSNWGGFLVTFPRPRGTPWELPTDGWHWDGTPGGRGLLIFSFYSRVEPRGGGTLVLSGSHRLIDAFYASLSPDVRARPHRVHRRLFARWTPELAGLNGLAPAPAEGLAERWMSPGEPVHVRGVPCRVVELSGEPGDAVFCDLGIYHSAAPNCRATPRFMRSKFLFLDEAANAGTRPSRA